MKITAPTAPKIESVLIQVITTGKYIHLVFSDYQSAFAIYGPRQTYISSTKVLVFPSTRTNIGDHYDTTKGQFTAQYAGIYVFILNLYKGSGGDTIWCYIRKNRNNVVLAYVPEESNAGYYESSASTVVHLNPGDKVDVGDCGHRSDIAGHTSFSGFLLQAD